MPGFGGGSFGRGPFGASNVTVLETELSETLSITEDVVIEGEATVSESASITEGLIVSVGQFTSVSESISVEDRVSTGSFQIETIGGHLVRVTFPTELHFEGILDASNYSLGPNFSGDPGAPLALVGIEPRKTSLQDGLTGRVVPESLGPGLFDLSDGLSTHFRLTGELDPVDNLGDFITITSGQNAGLYQIIDVAQAGPPEAIAVLDRPLALLDGASGIQSVQSNAQLTDLDDPTIPVDLQLITIAGNLYTFRVKHPEVTLANPVTAVYRASRLAREGSTEPLLNAGTVDGAFVAEDAFSLLSVTFLDYRTFRINDAAAPSLRGASLATIIDRFEVVVQLESSVEWEHTTGVEGVDLTTTKLSNERDYLFHLQDVFLKLPKNPVVADGAFKALGVPLPKIADTSLSDEGVLTVVYDEPMEQDPANLGNPADYVITGPTDVRVTKVFSLDPTQVVLMTQGLGAGSYTLTVSTSTPKDVAGNPLDPTFNEAIFTGSVSVLARSLFTDKGPIAKPALTLQSGTAAALTTYEAITLPGAVLTLDDIGKRLRLTGSASNDDVYEVLSIVSTNQAKVIARFILPDANSGAIDWELFDPRTGQIADDPSDVVVRVNSIPVVPDAVIGLRGQIVLSGSPVPTGDVEIDYSYICNPRVEVRRLNSLEFRLNAWNRDPGGHNTSGHNYRFNNVLISPSDYDPDDMAATLEQPLLRQLKYRAYERAYTAVFNDPNKLLFNTPIHKIAFPPASRPLTESSVFYEATTLPENDVLHPWVRRGLGSAAVSAGNLVVVDNTAGTFPTGSPIFWTQELDLSFNHVISVAWRFSLDTVTSTEGVWTGIAAGYSDTLLVYAVGYLDVGGVKKIGFLKRGAEDAVADASSWIGGVDSGGSSTNAPADFDWSILHSYRLFRDRDGGVRLYVDGDVVETLRVTADEAPFLKELNAPFDEIQGAFFGSLSRPAESTSTWDFYRYLIQPLDTLQISPSSFVTYEGNDLPEVDSSPWTPIGFHGTSLIYNSNSLLLDSTSATDAPTSIQAGLIGGDFHGYVKLEPLLTAASQIVVDTQVQLLTHTHGIAPNGLMLAVDDGTRLMQLCFFPGSPAPKLSYGGRSFPEDFSPYVWSKLGTQGTQMRGRVLRVTDASITDGVVYSIEDTSPVVSAARVVASTIDYMLETRLEVVSYTVDGSGFAGAFAQVFDGIRAVGLQLQELAGVRYVAFHSDGTTLGASARFAFEWNDGEAHTYRIRKSTLGDLVSLFVDGAFLGSFAYSSFIAPPPDSIGLISFGSSTPASDQALSVIDWSYCNAWRVETTVKRYVGLWKGSDPDALTGYHLPLKASGRGATVVGNLLEDPLADYLTAGVVAGDPVVVDVGSNKGTYEVAAIVTSTKLTIVGTWPAQPSVVDYRVVEETDWSALHKYRLMRDSTGSVNVLVDADPIPVISVDYDSVDLPGSTSGIVRTLTAGLPAITFGSFDAENLEQSLWDFVRYGISRSPTELRIVPPHHVLNQWNVMESPERLFTLIPHELTSFKSSSTGTTSQIETDFLSRDDVPAFTQLNQGTPLVPETQTLENRGPFVTQTFVASLNNPEDVLNNDGDFTFNDGTLRFGLEVPNDVLYTSLQVVRSEAGSLDLITPFGDECNPHYSGVEYQREVCLDYAGNVLPENDSAAPTPWAINSDNPGEVSVSAFSGILTYGTGGGGTKTAYLNNTPLPDSPSLQTEASFRLKLLQDMTLGLGDSQVRFGLSAPGMTVAIGFVTHPSGDRFVEVYDLNNGNVMGRASVDYLDGNYHDYRIVRNPSAGLVEVFIDS
jgi:hypothetical protein